MALGSHHFTRFVIFVTRSRKIESDRDYQKNKDCVQELKVLWKRGILHSTINKYIEILTLTRLQAFCLQIVTFKMLNSSPCFGVDRHFYILSPSSHELGSSRGCKFLPPISYGSRTSDLSPLTESLGW